MSILEPGEEPIEAEDVSIKEDVPAVAPMATVQLATKRICATCRRPGIELDRGWVHLDANVDHPSNPAFCLFVLFVEPTVRWGWLNDGHRPDFTVTDGRGSKGNGGLAA